MSTHTKHTPGPWAAKAFASMSMPELREAVAKKLPKASYNKKQMMLDLGDGRMVMFCRRGGNTSGGKHYPVATTMDVWTSDKRPEKIKMDISISSVRDAVSTLKAGGSK